MIRRVYINNYRNLVNFELRPGELTLLLGGNGSGKSSVLDVLYAIREVLSGTMLVSDPRAFSPQTLTRWHSDPLQAFELEVELGAAGPLTYRLEVEHDRDRGLSRVALERLSAPGGTLVEFERGTVRLFRDDHRAGPEFTSNWSESWLARFTGNRDNPRPTVFLNFIRRMVVCRLHPAAIRAESRGEEPTLTRDGANFAAWYRGKVQEQPDVVAEFMESAKQVIEGLQWMRLEAVGKDARALTLAFDYHGAQYKLNFDELSDGQRALIVLYAVLHFAGEDGYTLLLDEPDNFIALPELQPWLMALADSCGEAVAQAIVCSHHPEPIDYLGAEHGVLLDRDSTGPVKVRPIAERAGDALKLSEIIARGWEK